MEFSKQYLDVLEKNQLFKGIHKSEISSVLQCLQCNIKNYKKGEIIILGGSKVHSLGIVIDGGIQIVREDLGGNRMMIAGLTKGEIFAETFACGEIDVSPVSVYASEKSTILWILIKKIVNPCSMVCSFHSSIIMNLLELMAKKNMYLNQKLELLSQRSIREKIILFLELEAKKKGKEGGEFLIDLNRNELADYLCVDRSALSRELSKLKMEKIIDYHKNKFKLLQNY